MRLQSADEMTPAQLAEAVNAAALHLGFRKRSSQPSLETQRLEPQETNAVDLTTSLSTSNKKSPSVAATAVAKAVDRTKRSPQYGSSYWPSAYGAASGDLSGALSGYGHKCCHKCCHHKDDDDDIFMLVAAAALVMLLMGRRRRKRSVGVDGDVVATDAIEAQGGAVAGFKALGGGDAWSGMVTRLAHNVRKGERKLEGMSSSRISGLSVFVGYESRLCKYFFGCLGCV